MAAVPVHVPQNNEKQMRQLSVIPPMMYDSEQRRVKFINMNGLMDDPMKVYKARQFMNVWTEHEKEIFKEKWVEVSSSDMAIELTATLDLHWYIFVFGTWIMIGISFQVCPTPQELRPDCLLSGEKGKLVDIFLL